MVKSTTLVDMWPSSMVTKSMKAKHPDSIAAQFFLHHCLVTFSVSIPSKPNRYSGDIARLSEDSPFCKQPWHNHHRMLHSGKRIHCSRTAESTMEPRRSFFVFRVSIHNWMMSSSWRAQSSSGSDMRISLLEMMGSSASVSTDISSVHRWHGRFMLMLGTSDWSTV